MSNTKKSKGFEIPRRLRSNFHKVEKSPTVTMKTSVYHHVKALKYPTDCLTIAKKLGFDPVKVCDCVKELLDESFLNLGKPKFGKKYFCKKTVILNKQLDEELDRMVRESKRRMSEASDDL